jgi:superfamily II DNA or RNA helicase
MPQKIVDDIKACSKCGTDNPTDAKFCNGCGRKFRSKPRVETEEGPDPEIIPPEAEIFQPWQKPLSRPPVFDQMQFQLAFRKYQIRVLETFDSLRLKQNKFHLVAPPGAGKTILGIEMVKRLGARAVVFSPTSTIQAQWRDKCRLFCTDKSKETVLNSVSLDSRDLREIDTLTYQVLSTATDEKEFQDKLAIDCWKEDLLHRQKLDAGAVENRVKSMAESSPGNYRKEMARYREQVRKKMLRDPLFDAKDLLHPNARELISSLVGTGTRIVVLDECHHLLDYWAIIIRELIKRIGDCYVIGLTATPPYSAEEKELENYLGLVGQVDFEVPTPALVKNGDLAPYQDLVRFVQCTEKELAFLERQQGVFNDITLSLSQDTGFQSYFSELIDKHVSWKGGQPVWDDYL